MLAFAKNITREKIVPVVRSVHKETWIIVGFMILHFLIGPNRVYFLALAILIIFLYKVSGNFLNSLWLSFLATLPFGKGRYFEHIVISKNNWVGNWDLTFNVAILFSDLIFATIIYLLITRYKKKRKRYYSKNQDLYTFLSIVILLISATLSVYFARFPLSSFYFYLQLVKLLLLFYVALIVFKDKFLVRKTFQILGAFVFFNALLIIGQYINQGPIGLSVEGTGPLFGLFAAENPELYRPGGFAADPNIAATFFTTFLPIFLINALVMNKKPSGYSWAILAIIVAALLFTASRAAWVISVFSSTFIYLYSRKYYQISIPDYIRKKWIVLSIAFFLIFSPLIVSRLGTVFDIFNKEGGATYRLNHLKVGWHYLVTDPVGIGSGLFPFAMAQDFPISESGLRPTLAHNIFAQIGAELGFLGIAFFLIFTYLVIKRPVQKTHSKRGRISAFAFSILISFSSLFVLSLFFPWFLHPSIGWLFWILAAGVHSMNV